jgi:hypothetical protein
VPQCTTPSPIGTPRQSENGTRIDFGEFIPPAATDVRIALGVLSYCRYYANCSQVSNHTPVFDQAALGVFGQLGSPLIAVSTIDVPQDNFPANGFLRLDSPIRFDCNNVVDDALPNIGTHLGDTLIVDGATGGCEVWVDFAVVPGPFTSTSGMTSFLGRVTPTVTSRGLQWYTARMDTAEVGASGALDGAWMTAYHELDVNRQYVDDGAQDPNDPNFPHLGNDIFPDDLFTAGTRVNLFYRTKFETSAVWFILPDTTGGNYYEWEGMPSSAHTDSTWNCVLYVDHFSGRGAQPFIESALDSAIGLGGNNYEGTTWDRYDVNAPSSQQASLGRPLDTEFGASVNQVLAYDCVVWNSGNLGAFNVVKEDADILIPYLTLLDFAGNSLYLSGDGVSHSITEESQSEPSALILLEDVMGAGEECNTFRDLGCPSGGALDQNACVFLLPVGGSPPVASTSRAVIHRAQGNGCPQQRSFDVLNTTSPLYGATATGDEYYDNTSIGGKSSSPYFASVATDASQVDQPNYRTVIDGQSVHYRRDDGTPCDFNAGGTVSVDERIAEVLAYLGHSTASLCEDPFATIGVPGDVRPTYRTTLANFAPNPLLAGATGKITFTMANEGPANIDIFDVNGRLVKKVFDGIAKEGVNEAFWNGTDNTGRDVASGVYFYRLRAASDDFSKKMVVVRNGGN